MKTINLDAEDAHPSGFAGVPGRRQHLFQKMPLLQTSPSGLKNFLATTQGSSFLATLG
jgi:hypothetical protein